MKLAGHKSHVRKDDSHAARWPDRRQRKLHPTTGKTNIILQNLVMLSFHMDHLKGSRMFVRIRILRLKLHILNSRARMKDLANSYTLLL